MNRYQGVQLKTHHVVDRALWFCHVLLSATCPDFEMFVLKDRGGGRRERRCNMFAVFN